MEERGTETAEPSLLFFSSCSVPELSILRPRLRSSMFIGSERLERECLTGYEEGAFCKAWVIKAIFALPLLLQSIQREVRKACGPRRRAIQSLCDSVI